MNEQIEDIKNIYQKNTNNFSFTDTIGSFINNREFSRGYDEYKTGNLTENSYIYYSLSAIGQEFGERLYSDVIHYVDNVANVDTCKVKALKSMMYFLGIEYKVISNLDLFPVEIIDLIDVLSLNPKYLLYTNKLKKEFVDILIENGIIEDIDEDKQNYTINESEYNNFKKTLFTNLLSSYVSYQFSNILSTRVIDTYEFKAEYTGEQQDRQHTSKIFRNVDRFFNVSKIVDDIENETDSIDNYNGSERELIQREIDYRNTYETFDHLSSETTTRYAYYTRKKVLEYANFIDNKYYFDSIGDSDNINAITNYELDPNYFRVDINNAEKVIKYDDTGLAEIDEGIIEKTANSLLTITNYICKIRDNIKLQMKKTYMKGSFNLMQFMINEFLTEYSNNPVFKNDNLSSSLMDLKTHQVNDVKLKEYYDITEYYNIETNTSLKSDNPTKTNNRYWEYDDDRDVNGLHMAFTKSQIADFYLKSLCTSDTFKDENELFDFLSAIYNLGANDSYVNPDSIFHCQLNDGTYTTDLYPHIVGIKRNLDELSSHLSNCNYVFPEGSLESQISNVIEFIYSNISAAYLSDVYTISTDNELSIQKLNETYNNISSDFERLINDQNYAVYMNESKNRYCYKDNDSDNILNHDWKEEYKSAFFNDANLTSDGKPFWQTEEYFKYQEERQNQLQSFSERYINNYPLNISLSVINKQFDDISSDLMNSVINEIAAKYNYFDISSDTLDEEMDSAVKFLNKKIERLADDDPIKEDINQYIEKILKLSASYNDIYTGYQEMKNDPQQSLFLLGFDFQTYNRFNKKTLRQLSSYTIVKDEQNRNSILSNLNGLYKRYDNLINDFQEIANNVSKQTVEITYKPKYGYYENIFEDMVDNIKFETEMRLHKAQELINNEKTNVINFMYTDDYALQKELDIKYDLSSEQTNFYTAINNRLSDVNFFEFDDYNAQYDFYLSYTGRDESKFPYYNIKNVTHASYQIHPYLNQFIEESELEKKILESYDNGIIEELEDQNIFNNISSFIGDYGNIINTWSTGAMDYCGYRTRYEKSTNRIEVRSKTIKHELVDYDGAFYPPAIEDLFRDPSRDYYNEQISSISSMIEKDEFGEKTFYGKYYSHLGLSKDEAEFICNQLVEFHDKIQDIVTERTVADKCNVYDIYQYTLDRFSNSYVLYKKYTSEEPDYLERKNTTGELWIRKSNNPIAFPAFYGKYGNILQSSHDFINSMSGNTIFDMDIDDSLQLMALVTDLSGKMQEKVDNYSHGNVVFGKIQYIQDEKKDLQHLGFTDQEFDLNGQPKYFTKNFECETNHKLIGIIKPEVNIIQCVYVDDSNDSETSYHIDIITKDNIKDFTALEIKEPNYTNTFPITVEKTVNFKILGTDLAMSYNNLEKEYTFVTKLRYLQDDINIGTENGSSLSSYNLMSEDEYPDRNDLLKTTSIDSFEEYIGIIKYNTTTLNQSLIVCNLNADASYIPLYPGEYGKIKYENIRKISSDYYNFELLGRSRNIDQEIGMINPDADPYFDIDDIRKNYTFGRVYEDYDQIFDKTILIQDNKDILLKGKPTQEWSICLSDYNQYTKNDYQDMKVIFFNKTIYGNNPYYIGTLASITGKCVECNYMDIPNTKDTVLASNTQIEIAGTDDYFAIKKGLHTSNRLNNINNIKISFDYSTKIFKTIFYVENQDLDSFIPEGALQIVFYNPFDNQMFKFYHLFDTFGMIYNDWKNEIVNDYDHIQNCGNFNIIPGIKSYEQGIPSEDGGYDILSNRN